LQLLRLQLNSPEGRGIGEEAGKALLSLMIQDPEGLDAFLLILKSPSIKTYPTQIFPQGFAEEICRYLMGRATERSGGVSLGVSVSGGASGAGAGKGSSEISRELDTSEVLRLFAKLKLTKSMIEKMITGLPDRNLKLAVLNQILNKLPEDKDSLVAKIFWTPKGKVWHPAKKVTKGTLGRLILMRQTILYQEEAERAAQEAQGREAMRAAVLGSDPEGRFAFTFLGQVPTAPPMASTAPQGFVEATAIPVVPTAPPMASSATQGFGEATVIPVVPTAPPMAASDPMGFVEPVGTLPVFAGVVFPVAPTGPVVAQVTSFAAGAAEKKPEVLVPS
jgi:hypothetical protein